MKRSSGSGLLLQLQGVGIGFILALGCIVSPLANADGIDPQADKVLKAMSSYLGGVAAFSMNADIDLEVVLRSGQKLQLSSSAEAVMQRPDKMHIQRQGPITEADIIYDGKALTLYGKQLNVFHQTEAPGTIDDAIRAYEMETGLAAPGADLLFADPYAVLSSGVESSAHLGMSYVEGVECHHLAFREDDTDWQIWIKAGDEPLPMKYVITSKWQTAAPQYQIRFRDWDLQPQIGDDRFVFSPPKGAVPLETLVLDKLGGLVISEEGQAK
jgi:hypothetical protein